MTTVSLSGVYYLTSPLVLHHILEIASYLHACERDQNLRPIVAPMKLKFLKILGEHTTSIFICIHS
jgi:hypothetical protein